MSSVLVDGIPENVDALMSVSSKAVFTNGASAETMPVML